MALNPQLLKPYQTNHFSLPFISLLKNSSPQLSLQPTRRTTLISIIINTISPNITRQEAAKAQGNALDLFRMTVPDQTAEEAKSVIQLHAQSLLQAKELLDLGEWKEAQRELRKSSSLLKQDLYTLIQDKPGVERPQLRKLYSVLFNTLSRLDYAARDQDATRVRECYDGIVLALNQILSMILMK